MSTNDLVPEDVIELPGSKGRASKIDRYKWQIKDDQAGVLKHISKHKLLIDPEYQRDCQQGKVLKMAREWSWIACGVITVGQRGTEFYAIDGQHRILAARKRNDIDLLPCIVFPTKDERAEASAFLTTNLFRTGVAPLSKFKALLCAEDPAALIVQELITEAGRVPGIGSDKRTVTCLAALLKLAQSKPATLKRVWPLIVELCREHSLPNQIVHAMVYVEEHLPNGESLLNSRVRDQILRLGYDRIWDSIDSIVHAYRVSGTPSAYAQAVVNVINTKLRNKLRLEAQ
jgi:ParB-like nuclease domain.